MKNSGWDKPQNGFFAIDHQGVARIVAPLESHHPADLLGQPVDDLALALVTPLGADHDDIPALPPF